METAKVPEQEEREDSKSEEIKKALRPVIFMFQPTRIEVVTGERLKVWETYMREHVGLPAEIFMRPTGTGTISYSGPGPDSAPDDCDAY